MLPIEHSADINPVSHSAFLLQFPNGRLLRDTFSDRSMVVNGTDGPSRADGLRAQNEAIDTKIGEIHSLIGQWL
jgi:hypothetical protein